MSTENHFSCHLDLGVTTRVDGDIDGLEKRPIESKEHRAHLAILGRLHKPLESRLAKLIRPAFSAAKLTVQPRIDGDCSMLRFCIGGLSAAELELIHGKVGQVVQELANTLRICSDPKTWEKSMPRAGSNFEAEVRVALIESMPDTVVSIDLGSLATQSIRLLARQREALFRMDGSAKECVIRSLVLGSPLRPTLVIGSPPRKVKSSLSANPGLAAQLALLAGRVEARMKVRIRREYEPLTRITRNQVTILEILSVSQMLPQLLQEWRLSIESLAGLPLELPAEPVNSAQQVLI